MSKITETDSYYNNLEKMSIVDLLVNINKEDSTISSSVKKVIPMMNDLLEVLIKKINTCDGRLFYIGAGTSGRLGVLDASECPPTYGVNDGLVVGLIAGGDQAIRKAVEFAEDDYNLGWKDLKSRNISKNDFVIGIAASGTTPYVVGALDACRKNHITTACITCNKNTPLSKFADFPIEVIVGPEFVTGSTRMKSGTAQKLILNMISTSLMVKLGRVKGNKMVDMQLANNKLLDRGSKMIMKATGLSYQSSESRLKKYGSVRKAIDSFNG